MKTTPQSEAAALAYLRTRAAVHKLAEPVSLLFGNPQHGEAIRRNAVARAERIEARQSRRLFAWSIPFIFIP